MKQPHDNWGTYYDFVYEQTFGSFYDNLTTETLNVINQILPKGTGLYLTLEQERADYHFH